MSENLSILLSDVSMYSGLIPVLVGIFSIMWSKERQVKILLLLFLLIGLFFEFSAHYTFSTLGISNLPLLHVYTVIEFSLLILIFYYGANFPFNKSSRNILIFLFILFTTINGYFIEGFEKFNSNIRAVECILLIIFPLVFFFYLIKDLKTQSFERDPMFWISVAVFIYFAGNLITFIISNYALNSRELSFTIWGIHALLNILKNILFAIALWVNPAKQNSLLS